MLKRYWIGFIALLFINSSSCTFDTTKFSCAKMTNTSSVNIEELLKAPESVIIDNKDYEIIGGASVSDVGGGSVSIFPTFKTKNSCSSIGFRVINFSNNVTFDITDNYYKFKYIWVLSNNQLWENDGKFLEYMNHSSYYVLKNGPAFENPDQKFKIIVKISDDKGKEFLLKSKEIQISHCCV